MKTDQHVEEKSTDSKLCEGVYLGALMSPAEVKSATSGRSNAVPGELHRWTLCGDVDPIIFSMLNAHGNLQQDNERLTVFGNDLELHYAVFTHQAGYFQHRFLVPLYDPKAAACVRAVAHGDAMGYSLAGQGTKATVWATRLGVKELMPLLPMCSEAPAGRERHVLRDYVDTVMHLRDPKCIASSVEGLDVRFASVSAIAPESLLDRIAGRLGLRC